MAQFVLLMGSFVKGARTRRRSPRLAARGMKLHVTRQRSTPSPCLQLGHTECKYRAVGSPLSVDRDVPALWRPVSLSVEVQL